jgi:hypothetical protein
MMTRIFPVLIFLVFFTSCRPSMQAKVGDNGFYSFETRTGIADVDVILTALESGDTSQLVALFRFTTHSCTSIGALGGPPQCRAGEAENTPVEVLPTLFSEGSYLWKDEIENWQGLQVESLYAVFAISEQAYSDEYYPSGKYGIVLMDAGGKPAVIARVADEMIVRIDLPADASFETLDAILARDASGMVLPPAPR